jgi:hypothetical protein
MAAGERELPNLRVLQQKRNSEGFPHFFPPFFKAFLDYLPVLVVSGGDKRVRIFIIILTRV